MCILLCSLVVDVIDLPASPASSEKGIARYSFIPKRVDESRWAEGTAVCQHIVGFAGISALNRLHRGEHLLAQSILNLHG